MAITRRNMLRKIVKMREMGMSCPLGIYFNWSYGPRSNRSCFYSDTLNCKVCENLMKVDRTKVSNREVRQHGTKCYCPCNYWNKDDYKINSIILDRCKEYNIIPLGTLGGC